jgi:fanconi-associated nuclease 1
VEDFALEHYAKEGFKGYSNYSNFLRTKLTKLLRKHCEGRIVRFIFGLLFHDILFHPIPGAFETRYQTAPLDLVLDTFYVSRKSMIEKRLQEIIDGQASQIAAKVDQDLRENNIFVVGLRWDTFSREEILEIIDVSYSPQHEDYLTK